MPAQDATLDARGSAVTDVLSLTPPRHRALGSDYRRALREKDRETFDRIISKARQHASAASYCAHMDPTILAILSVLLEMEKDIAKIKETRLLLSGEADDENHPSR